MLFSHILSILLKTFCFNSFVCTCGAYMIVWFGGWGIKRVSISALSFPHLKLLLLLKSC